MAVSYDESEDVAAYVAGMSTAELREARSLLQDEMAGALTGKAEAFALMKRAKGKDWKLWNERSHQEKVEHWLNKAASRPIECDTPDECAELWGEHVHGYHLAHNLECECRSLEKAVGARTPCAACASCEIPDCDICLNCRAIRANAFRVEDEAVHLVEKAVGARDTTACEACARCDQPDCINCAKCRLWRSKAEWNAATES